MGLVKTLRRKSSKISNIFSKKLDLQNKNIILTGSNTGIGLELARKLVVNNNLLALVNKNFENLKILNEKKIKIIQCDFEENNLPNDLSNEINMFKPNILINCAGTFGFQDQDLLKIKIENFKKVLNINVFSPLKLIQISLESKNLEQIVNITSEMGSISNNISGGYYYYRGSKTLLNSISKNLSLDLKNKDINVFCIHPGNVKTKMNTSGIILPDISAQKIINILSENNPNLSGLFIGINKEIIKW